MAETPGSLIIGLDGATFDVLGPLLEFGELPNLAALMEKGCWGRLASTVPPFTAAAWSSFITGKNPGGHGVISFRKRDRFNYDTTGSGFVDARRFGETLWSILSAAGKRVGIVNVPLTYPPRPVNGYMVTGMMTPPNASQFTYPRQLSERLGADYVVDVDFIRDRDAFRMSGFPSKAEMLAQVRNMTRVRAQACARLLRDEAWDFFMVVFTSTDRILHFFWDDLTVLVNDGQPTDAIQQGLQAYFRELDDGIGQLVDMAGSSATVMVISDHGFGPAPTSRFYLNVWLERLGLLQKRGARGFFDLEHWRVVVGRNKRLKAMLRRILPQSTQDAVTAATASASDDIVAWSRTRAYFVPIYFHVCGVEVNLSGARREGIVQAGEEYEAIREGIIEEAKQLTDPRDGRPVVEMAVRREALYRGPYVSEFPDVILVLNPDYIGASSLAGSSLVEPHPHPMRPGEHRQDGIFIAAGPAVLSQGELGNLNLIDVPPTILRTLGIPAPSSYDGRLLEEIFDSVYLDTYPVSMEDYSPSVSLSGVDAPLTEGEPTADEEAAIEERLRGLGYLD